MNDLAKDFNASQKDWVVPTFRRFAESMTAGIAAYRGDCGEAAVVKDG
ncbi:hypothetical protein [Ramlibacter montanisoli]|uniref:Uncharacterized protein n=1 Tax=Ramlibacter montanisoli TaxID=2732512 RepID=A0A849KKH1_9BURK|nr:hypothetical protein [Ramlibacter montanisoli]NNU45285.1 hypothetical protein [Ramlibacter montanisoli]